MTQTRSNALFTVGQLGGEVDRFFSEFFGNFPETRFGSPRREGSFPPINVWEDEGHFYAEAEVPGLQMEDLEILVVGDELTVKGGRKTAAPEGATYHRQERGAGSFKRVLQLPAEVHAEKVTATLRGGVLTVTLPKAEAAKPRRIQVNVTG